MTTPARALRLLAIGLLSCELGPKAAWARQPEPRGQLGALRNRSGAFARSLEDLHDASKPFQAMGTSKESWYRCADYNPLMPGHKNIAEFRCLNGMCIGVGLYCNGYPNCADGSDEANCPKAPLHFDCNADLDEWGKVWSVDKKAWCCQHEMLGCLPKNARPHDCIKDREHWRESWSEEKKQWCCALSGAGCTRSTSSSTRTASTTTRTSSTATATSTSTSTSTLTSTSVTSTATFTSTTSATTLTSTTLTSTSSTTSTSTSTSTTTTTSTSITATTRTSTSTATTTRTSTSTATTTLTSTSTTATTFTYTSTTATTLTPTSTTASTTTTVNLERAAMACSEKDVAYFPLDMPGPPPAEAESIVECQARCASVGSCAHFSFWLPLMLCHLQDSMASRSEVPDPGFVSGPRACNEAHEQLLLRHRQAKARSSVVGTPLDGGTFPAFQKWVEAGVGRADSGWWTRLCIFAAAVATLCAVGLRLLATRGLLMHRRRRSCKAFTWRRRLLCAADTSESDNDSPTELLWNGGSPSNARSSDYMLVQVHQPSADA